jgi:hypothetical protein
LRIDFALKAQEAVDDVTDGVLQVQRADAGTTTTVRYAVVPVRPPLLPISSIGRTLGSTQRTGLPRRTSTVVRNSERPSPALAGTGAEGGSARVSLACRYLRRSIRTVQYNPMKR